jgi:hypothetical protein
MGHLYQSYVKFSGGHLVTLKEILPAERNEDHFSTFLANHRDPKHVDVTGSKSGREKKQGRTKAFFFPVGHIAMKLLPCHIHGSEAMLTDMVWDDGCIHG